MPLPLIAGAVPLIGKIIKSPFVKKIGNVIGNLFGGKKRKKKKAAEAAAKQVAQQKVFEEKLSIQQPMGTGSQPEKQKIPIVAWVVGGVLALALMFVLFFNRK